MKCQHFFGGGIKLDARNVWDKNIEGISRAKIVQMKLGLVSYKDPFALAGST